ncbi:hypothetical protein [Acetobacter vaccinii]|uniref:2'-5' RNA ligase family protein n=1 Tax=Acetobacter vaccinii TaxID=2592655 RepID=A0A5C1YQA5_9PROT|nr:hypothetical protein [Acetobacter vaccinii]QEO16982.1 hypothetical protein FLP30_03840 [Acetobacter vaccinii]
MFLIAGISLPPDMLAFYQTTTGLFPTRSWHPVPSLHLPLVSLGNVPTSGELEEMDQMFQSIHLPGPVEIRQRGYDIVEHRHRIFLQAVVDAPGMDHLSVKIYHAAQRAGLSPTRPSPPFGIPLAEVSDAPPEEVSLWLNIHHQGYRQTEEVYAFTVFSAGKNRDTHPLRVEAEYPFTAVPPPLEDPFQT